MSNTIETFSNLKFFLPIRHFMFILRIQSQTKLTGSGEKELRQNVKDRMKEMRSLILG